MSTASPLDEKLDKSAEHVDDVEYQKENQSSDGEHVSPIDDLNRSYITLTSNRNQPSMRKKRNAFFARSTFA